MKICRLFMTLAVVVMFFGVGIQASEAVSSDEFFDLPHLIDKPHDDDNKKALWELINKNRESKGLEKYKSLPIEEEVVNEIPLQMKIFKGLTDLDSLVDLENDINEWLTANKYFRVEKQMQSGGEYAIVITIWYKGKD